MILDSEKIMAMKRTTIGAIASIAVMGMVLATSAAVISSPTFSNSRRVRAVGVVVFANIGCTNMITNISWGILDPGDVANFTIYVRNNGTASVTLTMTTSNWKPQAASGNFTETWDKQNAILAAGSVTPAVLTLTVSPGAPGIANVTFDTTITGTQ
jgi:hypothetical protein